jgi:hypothetical protein
VNTRCLPVLFAGLVLLGCGSRGAQNETAVRQGVIDYLAQRTDLNMKMMQVDVTSVSFRQDEADATVSFRPKGAAGGGMQMRYTLERQGSRWVVKGKGRPGAGQEPHGKVPGGGMPGAGQSPHGGAAMPGGMPGGAPATGTPNPDLPPGHPAVNPPGAK